MADGVHAGHRGRMREKLLRYGADVFDTYELLEMLLYYTVPVKDTNPIAKALLSRFSGIGGVLHAEKEELLSVPDVGERTAALLRNAGEIRKLPVLYAGADRETVFDDRAKVRDYLIHYFAGKKEQSVVMLSLDNELRLLHVDELYHNDFASAAVKPEEFVRTAIRRNASVVVLGHNQLGKVPCAGDGDHATELLLRSKMLAAGVEYPAHFIVAGSYSYEFPAGKTKLRSDHSVASQLLAEERYDENYKQLLAKESEFECILCDFLFSLLLVPFGAEHASESAKKITSALHTPSHVFELSPRSLARKTEISESEAIYLRLVLELYLRETTDAFRFGRVHTREEIHAYLTARLLGRSEETVFLVCLDDAGKTVACELLGTGSVNSSQIIPRRIVELADIHHAKSVILAHNHPSGAASASMEDKILTEELCEFLLPFGIRLLSHGVYAGFCREEIEMSHLPSC